MAFVLKGDQINEAHFSYDWAQTKLWNDNIKNKDRLIIENKQLIFDGVNADQYILNDEKFPDRILFNLTGIAPHLFMNVSLKIPEQFSQCKVQAFLLRNF